MISDELREVLKRMAAVKAEERRYIAMRQEFGDLVHRQTKLMGEWSDTRYRREQSEFYIHECKRREAELIDALQPINEKVDELERELGKLRRKIAREKKAIEDM